MSIHEARTVNCPHCHQDFVVSVWQSLNATLDPEAKAKLLTGKLFEYTCPHCHATGDINYPILYHDMKHHAMIQYCPTEDDFEKAYEDYLESPGMTSGYMKARGYQMRFVNTQGALREKAVIFDAGLDDRIIELTKIFYALLQQHHNAEQGFNHIVFINHKEFGPTFHFATENSDEDFGMPMANEIYNNLSKALNLVSSEDLDDILVDAKWAFDIWTNYNLFKLL